MFAQRLVPLLLKYHIQLMDIKEKQQDVCSHKKITLTFFVSFKGKKCMIINYTYLHIMFLRFHQNDILILHYIYD